MNSMNIDRTPKGGLSKKKEYIVRQWGEQRKKNILYSRGVAIWAQKGPDYTGALFGTLISMGYAMEARKL